MCITSQLLQIQIKYDKNRSEEFYKEFILLSKKLLKSGDVINCDGVFSYGEGKAETLIGQYIIKENCGDSLIVTDGTDRFLFELLNAVGSNNLLYFEKEVCNGKKK